MTTTQRTQRIPSLTRLIVATAAVATAAVGAGCTVEVPDIDVPDVADVDVDLPDGSTTDALSAEGLDGLAADVSEHSGGTEVFRAVIYPEYATVDVPTDDTGSSKRQESFRWGGELDDFGGQGTAQGDRVDLADVDATVVLETVESAKGLVDTPTTWYAIVEGPGAFYAKGASITAHATNEFGESSFVRVTLDGEELDRFVSGE